MSTAAIIALVQTLAPLVIQGGEQVYTAIQNLVARWNETGAITEADVIAEFGQLKTYDEFGIPKAFDMSTITKSSTNSNS